ncbi:hypothetical protein M0802_016570 [Mischocyttarus mexicanus]|nr:hypothetical protein M0802_016570 [Mischocyttarus mexicanus]
MERSNNVEEVDIKKKCNINRKRKPSKLSEKCVECLMYKGFQKKRTFQIRDTDGKIQRIARIPVLDCPGSNADRHPSEQISRISQCRGAMKNKNEDEKDHLSKSKLYLSLREKRAEFRRSLVKAIAVKKKRRRR